jgi:FixJ family two-component response regulator
MEKAIVFVVDDDESVCRALKRLIKSAGLMVRSFTSAEEFLNQGCQNVPGCLVLDVRMPGMSGLELQQKLLESGSLMPIIFISAHEDPQAYKQAMENGASAFLQKPFEDKMILDAIGSAFSTIAETGQTKSDHIKE